MHQIANSAPHDDRPDRPRSPVLNVSLIVLQDVFDQGLVEVPRRLGIIRLKPTIKSLVLVSNGARISRPRSKAVSEAAGLDHVIKLDQFRTTIERDIDKTSSFALASNVRGADRRVAPWPAGS